MIIYNLNIENISILKTEADAPLIIDTDAPLAFAMPSKRLQSIAGRDSQILNCMGIIQHLQFSFCDCGK